MSKINKTNRLPFFLMAVAAVMCLSVQTVFAQSTIKGTVVDDKNVPVTGATLIVTNAPANYAVTDEKGQFSIHAQSGDVIEVTFLGYLTQQVEVGSSSILNITLQTDYSSLEEVIVTAYGSTKKASFSGSASVVKSDQLERLNGGEFTQALQGMSAGVQVTNFASSPGAEARIQIRGISSMSGSSNPLYIVDGMPYDGGLNSINPSDIESLTVLKDAAASSLYGSRAANGVVIITTKKGVAGNGNVKVNFRAAWGTSDLAIANPTTIADPKETLLYNWEALYNDYYYASGMTSAQASAKASELVVSNTLRAVKTVNGVPQYVSPFKNGIDGTKWVLSDGNGNPYINPDLEYAWQESDWNKYDAAYSRKLRQDYGIDVSGTSENGKTNYYLSAGYLNDQGYLLQQYYKRYSFRANVTSQIKKWLQIGGSVSYTYYRQNNGGIWGANRAIIYSTSLASPWLRNEDNTDWCVSQKSGKRMYSYGDYQNGGFFGYHFMTGNGDYWDNGNDESFSNDDGHNITARYFMEFTLPFDIKFRSSVNLDSNISNNYSYGSAVHDTGQNQPWGLAVTDTGGSAERSENQLMSLTWNNVLTWGHDWGKHHLDLMAGQEAYQYTNYYHYAYGGGIMQIGQYELASTTVDWYNESSKDKYSLLSFFGKADYNFAGKYYLSGSYRRDGSSRFHPDNRWGNFFSVGASWRISNEEWLKNSNWLQNLVLRASYGTSGNDKLISRGQNARATGEVLYGYQGLYEANNLYTIAGLRPSTIATPNLQWEKNKQFNVALDFTVFKDITATVEYYTRQSDDLLYYKTLPLSAQAGSVEGINTNIGTLRNSGFEFTVSANAIHKQNFNWRIDANLSTLKNEIVYLPSEPFYWSASLAKYYMAEGNSLYDLYTVKTDGIDPETGLVRYIKADGSITNDYTETSQDDYQKIGSTLPKVYGSLTNSFNFYGVDLSFMFYYSLGAYMFDQQYWERTRVRHQTSPLSDLVESRWRKPGDVTDIPRFTESNWGKMMGACDRYIFKNDYLRLRNLTIGYTLPSKVTKKMGVEKLRFYLSGDNLMTFGDCVRRYAEPEGALSGNNYNGNVETDSGLPGGRRVYMGGIQLSF